MLGLFTWDTTLDVLGKPYVQAARILAIRFQANIKQHVPPGPLSLMLSNTRWFKYDRDYLCVNKSVCPGHIWTTLYLARDMYHRNFSLKHRVQIVYGCLLSNLRCMAKCVPASSDAELQINTTIAWFLMARRGFWTASIHTAASTHQTWTRTNWSQNEMSSPVHTAYDLTNHTSDHPYSETVHSLGKETATRDPQHLRSVLKYREYLRICFQGKFYMPGMRWTPQPFRVDTIRAHWMGVGLEKLSEC